MKKKQKPLWKTLTIVIKGDSPLVTHHWNHGEVICRYPKPERTAR
jgi:hypothetical protein